MPAASVQSLKLGRAYRFLMAKAPRAGEPRRARAVRQLALVLVTLIALAVGLFRIEVPFPWADEAATVIALQRSWPDLLILFNGMDAPLTAYYLMTKAWVGLLPGVPVLVAARSLSALAAALTVACLFSVVVRKGGLALALTSSAFLISMPAFTRYAQEARPYASFAFAAGLSWLAWVTWRRPDQRLSSGPSPTQPRSPSAGFRDSLPYLTSLVALVVVDIFGFFQWCAQVVAELTAPGLSGRSRRKRLLWISGVMGLALVISAYVVVLATLRGHGPPRTGLLDLRSLGYVYLKMVNVEAPYSSAWSLTALAAVAVAAVLALPWARVRYSELVRITAIWLVVPIVSSFGLAFVRPNLLRARYLHPMTAPLAVLAAVGVFILAELIFRLLKSWRLELLGVALSAALTLGAIGAQVVVNDPAQWRLRAPAGHRNDFASALQLVQAELQADPQAQLVAGGRTGAAILTVTDSGLGQRNIGYTLKQKSSSVWPVLRSPRAVSTSLAGSSRVVWLLTKGASVQAPSAVPTILEGHGFTLISVADKGDWWVAVLER